VVTPIPQRPPFIDEPYYDQLYPCYRPSPNYSLSFQEKVLQAIDRIKKTGHTPPLQPINLEVDRFSQYQQSIMLRQQSIDELMNQTDRLLVEINREELRVLPSQSESNLERHYQVEDSKDPLISSE